MTRTINHSQRVVYDVDEHLRELVFESDRVGNLLHHEYGSTFLLPHWRSYASTNDAQLASDEILSIPEVRRIEGYPPRFLLVKESPYADMSDYRNGTIRLAANALNELTLVHEIAHAFGGGGHGDRWRKAYQSLASVVWNPQFATLVAIKWADYTQQLEENRGNERH